jgi:hypothetical protein
MTAPGRTRLGVLALAFVVCVGIVLGLVAVAAQADVPTLLQPQPRLLKMRRVCDGCPNYAISLTGDGVLTFDGGDFALAHGVRQSYVDPAIADALFDAFVQSEFMDMEGNYPSPGTEKMTVSLTVQIGSYSKSVFSEDRYGPALRLELERRMDDLPGMRGLSGWTF